MAINIYRSNGIIQMTAGGDKITEALDVDGILIASTTGAAFEVRDGSEQVIAAITTVAGQLSVYIPLRRRIVGIDAHALPNGSLFVYLRKR